MGHYDECRENEAKVPFSRHDNRNARLTQHTTIAGLTDRIHQMAERHGRELHGIASQLEQHADMLYGAVPLQTADGAGRVQEGEPYYGEGQMAGLCIALDVLDRQLDEGISRVATQAGRNSTLA